MCLSFTGIWLGLIVAVIVIAVGCSIFTNCVMDWDKIVQEVGIENKLDHKICIDMVTVRVRVIVLWLVVVVSLMLC